MTPTAWKKPSLTVKRAVLNPPFSELGTLNPWVTTATRMTDILINARALAFASYKISAMHIFFEEVARLTFAMSLYKLKG